jgi:hypothetical protein
LAELLGGLSMVADLGYSLARGEAMRSCVVGAALARALGLPERQVSETFYTTLFRHIGCVGFAHELTTALGDDLVANAAGARTNFADVKDVDLTWCVIDGTLTFVRDGVTHEVRAGHAIYMPKDQPHTFLNQTERPVIGLMVCTPGGFEGLLAEMAAALRADGGQPDALAVMRDVGARYGMDVAER